MKTILIIEDELDIIEVLEDYMKQLGCSTISCTNTQDAIPHISNPDVCLIITDLHLPIAPGLSILPTILRDRPGLPVVVFSGNINITNKTFAQLITTEAECMSDSVSFVEKPGFGELIEVVKTCLKSIN